MIGVKIIKRYRDNAIKMEMDGDTYALLSELLDYWNVELLVTRNTIGKKIVAVIKTRGEMND